MSTRSEIGWMDVVNRGVAIPKPRPSSIRMRGPRETSARSPAARRLVQGVRTRFSLTEAESRIVLVALASTAHRHLSTCLGVTDNTIKRHVASILAKTREATLEGFLAGLRESLLSE